MSSGADLFVVCKHCGSEVSPYITECPYCGHRLRQRAPKIPRETARRGRRGSTGLIARLRARPARRREATLLSERRRAPVWARLGAESRPYATITLVALALLAAWSSPDLAAARAGDYYEGDLLGTGALAALLLAVPFARPEVSWLAGLTGGALGALFGLGLYRASSRMA